MKATILVLLILVGSLPGLAAETPRAIRESDLVFGGAPSLAKTVVDTQLVLGPWGSGAAGNGQFENPAGTPDWNGWTHHDLTAGEVVHWRVGAYQVPSGQYAAWCGEPHYPACSESDAAGGYGNGWNEVLEWRGRVADPQAPCTVSVSALVNHHTEYGYDFSTLSFVREGQTIDAWIADGYGLAVSLAADLTYQPGQYEGVDGDEVVVRFRVTSDGAYSDEDCFFPSTGALQVDDVTITLSNGDGVAHDFEDGTLGPFTAVLPPGVGDFAALWSNLDDRDFCADNASPQVAFIDDGLVVPGTGGTVCLSWCYGPGGYVVNHDGGLLGPNDHLHNAVHSPALAWPQGAYEGADLAFDVYRDLLLTDQAAGIFYTWSVRSTADLDPEAVRSAPWRNRNTLYYGGPDYFRWNEPVGDLIVPGARWVQVQLAVNESGYWWGWDGPDASPAPYFDNVRLTAHPYHGPSLVAAVPSLGHDAFPPDGVLDLENLGANSVRFDSGQNIAGWGVARNDPGDSMVVEIKPRRAGAALSGPPQLHYRLQRNPLFDPFRSAGLPDVGAVDGWPVATAADRFAFDLPDTGFLFPGDLLHYYISATDEVGGVHQTALLPADTTGFGRFGEPLAYLPIWKIHALPSLRPDPQTPGGLTQPKVLFWDDAGARGNRDEWYHALRALGLLPGEQFDIYYTNAPASGVGNGLGGRATTTQIDGYDEILYTSGTLTALTLADGDPDREISADVPLLTSWLESGGKDLLLAGDDLAGDLLRTSAATQAFLGDWLGVTVTQENIGPSIGGQTAPQVLATADNPVLLNADRWLAVSTCAALSSGYYGSGGSTSVRRVYDGVELLPGAVRLAEFADPAGLPGAYPFSAATLNERPGFGSRVISLPYDLMSVWTDPAAKSAPPAQRAVLLGDILTYFDRPLGVPTGATSPAVLTAASFPNPFNPVVRIAYDLPRPGRLSVTVFDVRGRRVRTLADGPRPAGPGHVLWDGTDAAGAPSSSGLYFYEVAADGQTRIGKMTLVK